MRYLLDTHIFLWMLEDDPQLVPTIRHVVVERANQLYLSITSLLEIAIKLKVNKLTTQRTVNELVAEADRLTIELLPVQPAHLAEYLHIPLFDDHRDPFDRLLIATARTEGMTLISADRKFDRYTDQITLLQ